MILLDAGGSGWPGWSWFGWRHGAILVEISENLQDLPVPAADRTLSSTSATAERQLPALEADYQISNTDSEACDNSLVACRAKIET